MLIYLLNAFNTNAEIKSAFGDVQTSFNFEQPPAVVFVRDIATLEQVDLYDDLETHVFSEADQEKIDKTREEIKRSGGYDGDQLLITNLVYDTDSNTLYVVAKKVKYSFIRTLQKPDEKGGFDPSSAFYQKSFSTAGVRAPFITNQDDHTFFMMRTRPPKVLSVAAGLLEPPQGRLHPKESKGNLISHVAHNESLEEFLGNPEFCHEPLFKQLLHAEFKMEPQGINAIAIRRAKNSLRTEIEFIFPFKIDCSYAAMHNLLRNNKAKDAKEHSLQSIDIPLNADMRQQAEQKLASAPDEGKYVRDPIIAVTSMVANRRRSHFFPRALPGRSTTEFIPISSLTPMPKAPLTDPPREIRSKL